MCTAPVSSLPSLEGPGSSVLAVLEAWTPGCHFLKKRGETVQILAPLPSISVVLETDAGLWEVSPLPAPAPCLPGPRLGLQYLQIMLVFVLCWLV